MSYVYKFQAYDSVWREGLFYKLTKLGFGGKTLSLIKSMYMNDHVHFLINGSYSDKLFLTRGVKQGKNTNSNTEKFTYQFLGCNLSPLLFSLYISGIGEELNSSGLGIDLQDVNISAILFADDLVLIGKSREALNLLMEKTRRFFSRHKLDISETKSKILSFDAAIGKVSFEAQDQPPLLFDQVLAFKYLGILVNCTPYNLFKSFNDQVKKRARNYLTSVLSLVRSGPNRSDLAYSLWTNCALPSILYGAEIIPLTKESICEIERCNTVVGKFILGIPRSSANVSVYIDAGLRPIPAVIAEKVLLYASSIMSKPVSYWPKRQ